MTSIVRRAMAELLALDRRLVAATKVVAACDGDGGSGVDDSGDGDGGARATPAAAAVHLQPSTRRKA